MYMLLSTITNTIVSVSIFFNKVIWIKRKRVRLVGVRLVCRYFKHFVYNLCLSKWNSLWYLDRNVNTAFFRKKASIDIT